MKQYFYVTILLLVTTFAHAQYLQGVVRNNNHEPIIGATVQIVDTTNGAITNAEGQFQLQVQQLPIALKISAVGYQTNTINITNTKPIMVQLQNDASIEAVVIENKTKATEIDELNAQSTEVLGNKELLKAACCNLSESFENNATVDVSFTDAVTGSKQISMLGLAGIYSQINYENMPLVRGANQLYGLSYIPGSWVNTINVGKGAGSVTNGYESITGQIDVQLHQPDDSSKLYFDSYQNIRGRSELNSYFGKTLNEQWSTASYAHLSGMYGKNDQNKDTFLDQNKGSQINVMNRWKYVGKKNLRSQFGAQFITDQKLGGQTHFNKNGLQQTGNAYGTQVNTNRLQVFAKNGLIYPSKPYKSIGFITNGVYHKQDAFFGKNQFDVTQKSLYGNLIYQTIIRDTRHKIKTGSSIQLDQYNQNVNAQNFTQLENQTFTTTGVFAEYDYDNFKNIKILAGLRGDYFNTYKTSKLSPRLHIKYDVNDDLVLRTSIGKGSRIARVFSEHPQLLASNREITLNTPNTIETAWNYGISANQFFNLNNNEGSISVDFFRTSFNNQIMIDQISDATKLLIYNSDETSYANSLQVNANYELAERFDLRLAYKKDDVKQTLNKNLIQKPFVPKQRALINLAYATNFERLQFDATAIYTGKQQLVATANNIANNSPIFMRYNAQVTAKRRNWDIYLGGENLSNFTQNNPITGIENPFGSNFDASNIWGPIQGTNIYLGARYKLKQEKN